MQIIWKQNKIVFTPFEWNEEVLAATKRNKFRAWLFVSQRQVLPKPTKGDGASLIILKPRSELKLIKNEPRWSLVSLCNLIV